MEGHHGACVTPATVYGRLDLRLQLRRHHTWRAAGTRSGAEQHDRQHDRAAPGEEGFRVSRTDVEHHYTHDEEVDEERTGALRRKRVSHMREEEGIIAVGSLSCDGAKPQTSATIQEEDLHPC